MDVKRISIRFRDAPPTLQELKRKHRLKEIKVGFWCAFTAFCWGITPYAFICADQERGYDATGGEIFIPLIPFILFALVKAFKEIIYEVNNYDDV
jgi:hypothetical protein